MMPLDEGIVDAMTSPEYLMVADLERFQHYKDRCPPWVKLHWSMLDDPRFIELNEVNRQRYLMCILIASRVENRIKNDPVYLSKMMRLSETVDLTPLIDSGLLLAWRKRSASDVQAKCYSEKRQSQSQRRNREEERGSLRGRAFSDGRQVGMEKVGSTVGSIILQAMNQNEQSILEKHPHLRNVES